MMSVMDLEFSKRTDATLNNKSSAAHHDTRFFILQGANISAHGTRICDSIGAPLPASLCTHILFPLLRDSRCTVNGATGWGGSPDGTNTVGAWLTFQNVGWVHDQMLDLLPIAVVTRKKGMLGSDRED